MIQKSEMSQRASLFTDTSIQIAARIHEPATRNKIRKRISLYESKVASLVVRHELRAGLLKDLIYLHGLFENQKLSLIRAERRVDRLRPRQPGRYARMRQSLMTLREGDDESSKRDRARITLRYLIKTILKTFDSTYFIVQDSGCASGKINIEAKKRSFSPGKDQCKHLENCRIGSFLKENRDRLAAMLSYFEGLPDERKSRQIRTTETFIREYLMDELMLGGRNVCKQVGDLLIALESSSIPDFYTMNGKESQHFCRLLNQTMIILGFNPENEEIVCDRKADEWKKF